jgi:hypothetical protein
LHYWLRGERGHCKMVAVPTLICCPTLRAADSMSEVSVSLRRLVGFLRKPIVAAAAGGTNSGGDQDDVVPQDFPLPLPARRIEALFSATIIYRWWLIVTNLVLFYFALRIILRAQNVA